MAPAVNLSRFAHDLHFGRGLVAGIGSLLVNDAGGALCVALPLTGLLFWALPLAWKRRGATGKTGHAAQRKTMRWLHLSHAVFMGILALIPVTYLSLTGILLDHREELNDWMRSIQVPRGLLPPVYGMGEWEGEIYSALGYPGEPDKFSLGTRSGLFTTDNGGANWRREPLPGPPACFVWSLRRLGGAALAGGMGCPNYALENGAWRPVKGVGHMPSDVAALPAGRVWKSHAGFTLETPGGMKKLDWPLPAAEGMPLFALVDGLHSGLIFHPQWKWVNDAVAALALVLTGTGLVRLWRKRWSVARGLAWREAEEPPLTPVEAAHG
ncbi:MAG: PepSY domain-containing protein [Nitrospinae bacterium]|nr:PepSY domain-containing protein [Nitrospinota bacterium]